MIEARLTELNNSEILAFLGSRGRNLPAGEIKRIEECKAMILDASEPKLVYKRLPISEGKIDGIELSGNDIWELLDGAAEAVIFAATIGLKADQLIARLQVQDMAMAVIADACASCAIENVCDNFEADMRLQAEREGYFLTERYSPGYGDLPLEMQKDLGRFLNCHRRIGVIVSDNYMMTPVKSVTAIMGITKKAKECRIHKCETCTSRDTCQVRAARLAAERK